MIVYKLLLKLIRLILRFSTYLGHNTIFILASLSLPYKKPVGSLDEIMTSLRTIRINSKLFVGVIFGVFTCFVLLLLIIKINSIQFRNSGFGVRSLFRGRGIRKNVDRKPTVGQSIVFHETTCCKSGLVRLNSGYFS